MQRAPSQQQAPLPALPSLAPRCLSEAWCHRPGRQPPGCGRSASRWPDCAALPSPVSPCGRGLERGRRPSSSLPGWGDRAVRAYTCPGLGALCPFQGRKRPNPYPGKSTCRLPLDILEPCFRECLKGSSLCGVALLEVCPDFRVSPDPTLRPDSGGLCWQVSPELIFPTFLLVQGPVRSASPAQPGLPQSAVPVRCC